MAHRRNTDEYSREEGELDLQLMTAGTTWRIILQFILHKQKERRRQDSSQRTWWRRVWGEIEEIRQNR